MINSDSQGHWLNKNEKNNYTCCDICSKTRSKDTTSLYYIARNTWKYVILRLWLWLFCVLVYYNQQKQDRQYDNIVGSRDIQSCTRCCAERGDRQCDFYQYSVVFLGDIQKDQRFHRHAVPIVYTYRLNANQKNPKTFLCKNVLTGNANH